MKAGESTYIIDPNKLEVSGSLALLTKRYGEALEKKYPGWWWMINPDEAGGIIYIYSLRLSGEWGYTIKIGEVENDCHEKVAITAGGEILERFGLRRGKYHRDLLRGKITNLRGDYIPDITDASSRQQKKRRDMDFTRAVNEGKAAVVTRDTVQADGKTYRQIAIRIGEDT
jgi:hypothetical protein